MARHYITLDEGVKKDVLAALNKLGQRRGVTFEYDDGNYGGETNQFGIFASVNGAIPCPVAVIHQESPRRACILAFPFSGLNILPLSWDELESGRLYLINCSRYRADSFAEVSGIQALFNLILARLHL